MNCQTNQFLSVRNRAVLLSGGLRLFFCQVIPERLAGAALSQGEADVGVHTVDEVGGHQNAGGDQDAVVGGAQDLEEGFRFLETVHLAEDCREGVVHEVHQHGEFQGACLVIDIAEKHSEGKCRKSLPRVQMNQGEDQG